MVGEDHILQPEIWTEEVINKMFGWETAPLMNFHKNDQIKAHTKFVAPNETWVFFSSIWHYGLYKKGYADLSRSIHKKFLKFLGNE